ncbi:MAG: TolC family protein [Spirosomaceae bacterium]|nr:TolC family protein [Spirosomataceae bacterium]
MKQQIKNWIYVFSLIISVNFDVFAQNIEKTLSYIDFYGLILKNHPVVKLANLEIDYAQTELLQAKGQFDPKLISGFDRKAINGDDYYNRWVTDLKIPVWGGIDVKLGNERNSGKYLRRDESDYLNFAGFSVPVGRGMLLDTRRNTLEQTKIYQNIAKAEQQKMINKIIFSAAKDYWEWYLAYQNFLLQKEGLDLAQNRFELLVQRAKIGEVAAVDSVEAKITYQDRQVGYQQAAVDYINTTVIVSNYLWNNQEQPLMIPEGVIPQTVVSTSVEPEILENLRQQAQKNHPEIAKLNFKFDQLKIEERFRREMLKPQLDLSYSVASSPKYGLENYSIIRSNHKIGVDFEMPLFLRKERGKLQQVKIKQLQTDLDRRQLSREITNEVNIAYNEAVYLMQQLKTQQDAVKNQEILLKAEQNKFQIGESSLFLINSRESKLIDMRLKVEALKSKYQKAMASMVFAAGLSELP